MHPYGCFLTFLPIQDLLDCMVYIYIYINRCKSVAVLVLTLSPLRTTNKSTQYNGWKSPLSVERAIFSLNTLQVLSGQLLIIAYYYTHVIVLPHLDTTLQTDWWYKPGQTFFWQKVKSFLVLHELPSPMCVCSTTSI